MVRMWKLAAVAAALILPGMASAQTTYSRPYIVVARGGLVTVFKSASLNPDCSSLGRSTINLVTAPQGGQVSVGEIRDFLAYIPANPRSACNRRKVATTQLVYRARPDFTGTDRFAAEVITPDGGARTFRFTVQVR